MKQTTLAQLLTIVIAALVLSLALAPNDGLGAAASSQTVNA